MSPLRWLAIIVTLCVGFAASYGLALAGEPSSQWLWCEIMRLC